MLAIASNLFLFIASQRQFQHPKAKTRETRRSQRSRLGPQEKHFEVSRAVWAWHADTASLRRRSFSMLARGPACQLCLAEATLVRGSAAGHLTDSEHDQILIHRLHTPGDLDHEGALGAPEM